MVIAILQPGMALRPEVMTARNDGKIEEIAGVELLLLAGMGKYHIHMFFHPITVTGGTDLGASPAGETFLPPLLPDRGLKLQIKDLGQIGGINMGNKLRFFCLHLIQIPAMLTAVGLAAINLLQQMKGPRRKNLGKIEIIHPRQKEIKPPQG